MTTAPAVTDRLAKQLLQPAAASGGVAQSLADGAAGIALLHIERAHGGAAGWSVAHTWLKAAVGTPVFASDINGLYSGAPAVAFALHAAAGDDPGRYHHARRTLGAEVTALTHRRVERAMHRIRRNETARVAEFDIINGLTGVGAHLLQHHPTSDAFGRVLTYLVALSKPVRRADTWLPGWWTDHDPHGALSAGFPGGHANHGMAHGVTGPLALLALALRRGLVVDDHHEAIDRICTWLDRWRQEDASGPWWPQWITTAELASGRVTQPEPGRPSWCYGTPGIARAQQLAGIATADSRRQALAEAAMRGCLGDRRQLDRITDAGLCHGWAGLLHTARRASSDTLTATTSAPAAGLDAVTRHLLAHLDTGHARPPGFLEGAAGAALALHATTTSPMSGWDACLLIT